MYTKAVLCGDLVLSSHMYTKAVLCGDLVLSSHHKAEGRKAVLQQLHEGCPGTTRMKPLASCTFGGLVSTETYKNRSTNGLPLAKVKDQMPTLTKG